MNIKVDEQITLTPFLRTDKASLVRQINDKEIYDNTLLIPFPYTEQDADYWFDFVENQLNTNGIQSNWAIRKEDGQLIGGIGFQLMYGKASHKDELGYWLARDYWGKGIMTNVVERFVKFGFEKRGLVRIAANVFSYNKGSARVLEKVGFKKEGVLRKSYFKDDRYIDGFMYALIK